MPERIRIYFVDNHVLEIEREKAVFTRGDECFDLSETKEDKKTIYGELVRDGRAMINWDNVCFVKEISREAEEE